MKIALLGAAGFIGRTTAAALSRRPEVGELILVDYVIRDAKRMAKALSPKCRWAMADVSKPLELMRLMEGVDAVANAVGPCPDYEKPVLQVCADARVATASIGETTLPDADRAELDAAFRAADVPAVVGCGMAPGWTELLSAHFLSPGVSPAETGAAAGVVRFLFFSPDRFGGYAFRRGIARETLRPTPPPQGAPAGVYFGIGDRPILGVPEGKAARRLAFLAGTIGKLGVVGKEFTAALLLWMRGSMGGLPGSPAATAGVSAGQAYARVEDNRGTLAGILLAEAALRLAARPRKGVGHLPLSSLLGREEAERIAGSAGAKIVTGA
jgi:hypothetical protein